MPLLGLLVELFDTNPSRSALVGVDRTMLRAAASTGSSSDPSTRALLALAGQYVAGGTANWAFAEIEAANKDNAACRDSRFNLFGL